MEDKTIKEICDVVTAEVMKQVQANLATMKPQIIEEITNKVLSKINSNNNSTNPINTNTINTNPQQHSNKVIPRWGTTDFSDEQKEKILKLCKKTNDNNPNAVDNISVLSAYIMEKIISHPFSNSNIWNFLIKDNWIYYIKPLDRHQIFIGNGLFRVHINGTHNEMISDENVLSGPWGKPEIAEFYIKNDILHFTTYDYLPRIINLNHIKKYNSLKKPLH